MGKLTSPPAVVIGLHHYIGLQSARILSRRGIPVVGITADPTHAHVRTRVCREIICCSTLSESLVVHLIALGKRLEQKAVLYPCQDVTVLLLSRHRAELAPYFHIALPDHETVDRLMHKVSFYRFAEEEGLPIPGTRLLRDRGEAEAAAHELTFPCVLKPTLKTPEWEARTNFKAFRLQDPASFLDHYDRYAAYADVLVVQEWIPGGDDTLYACNGYFGAGGEPLAAFTSKSIRKWYPETGNTCLGQECRCEAVLQESLRLFRKVRFHGLAYLEMKRDERSGDYIVMEVNIGRPTGKSALADACGVELLHTMYLDQLGRTLPHRTDQPHTGKKWIHLRHDLQSALTYRRRGELTLREWWRSIRGRKTYAVFSWSDPGPFLCGACEIAVRLIRAALRQVAGRSGPSGRRSRGRR